VTHHFAIGIFLLFIVCPAASAQIHQFHPPERGVNLGDTTFIDGIAAPGLAVEQIVDFYHAGEIGDASGRTTSVPSINIVIGQTRVTWLSKRRILGAWYGLEAIAFLGYVHVGGQGHAAGLADPIVSPMVLQWPEKKIGPVRVDQRVDFDFFLPVGQYSRTSAVNLGTNTFSANPYYCITVFAGEHWETSWRVHYLWNAVNHAPPLATGLRSTQAGQAILFCSTLGYRLTHSVWIGPNAYYLKQITDPYINGVQVPDSREQVGAIGPGIVWDLRHFLFFANAYHEFGVFNRPVGNKMVLRVMWVPGRK
jgi:hypothetical protein